MAEVTKDMIHDLLTALQVQLGNTEKSLDELRGDVRAFYYCSEPTNSLADAIRFDISNIYKTMGTMDSRLSRIERRLEIIDTPVIGS